MGRGWGFQLNKEQEEPIHQQNIKFFLWSRVQAVQGENTPLPLFTEFVFLCINKQYYNFCVLNECNMRIECKWSIFRPFETR